MHTATDTYSDRVAFLARQISPDYLHRVMPEQQYTTDQQHAMDVLIIAARRVAATADHVAEVLEYVVFLHRVAHVICTMATDLARRTYPDRPGVALEVDDYYTALCNANNALAAARGKAIVTGPAHTPAEAQAQALYTYTTARRLLMDEGDEYAAYVLDHLCAQRYTDDHALTRAAGVAHVPEEITALGPLHADRVRPAMMHLITTATELGAVDDDSPYADLVEELPEVYCTYPDCTQATSPDHHHYTRVVSA
ncbi:hypothetical protein [Corynebacterium sp. HMSC05E07]|uniref:hypothetical protein n=1 Tax=Corynebacterium sp. HMSC05E07 TaxID=1581117 RepID=UPI0008A2C5CE|nr:hypothetical protein [Corynebacterium sp. HMSC05E07]OFT59861.1 hypothetical protein HMPREF3149_09245 [Corynebacterium sp. HMSC05E07]